MDLKVYSTNCPRCKVLIKKLEQKNLIPNVDFTLIEEEDKVMEKAEELNIQFVPFLLKDGELFSFEEAVKWINNL